MDGSTRLCSLRVAHERPVNGSGVELAAVNEKKVRWRNKRQSRADDDTLFYFEWWLAFVTALHSLLRNQPPSAPHPPFRPYHQTTSAHFPQKGLVCQIGVENIRTISCRPSIPASSPATHRLIASATHRRPFLCLPNPDLA